MGLEEKLPNGILLSSLEKLVNWTRKASLFPATFGLACCAIEMMTTGAPRYDLGRFGMEVFRASPRQADLMIVAGRVSQKMAPVLRQIYDQMAEPKWVLAMGVCASSGGMFNNYAIVQGVDHVVPVDMYLPGCPPRPEMLIDAILKLHAKIMDDPINSVRAADLAGRRTDLVPSSIKYGRNGVVPRAIARPPTRSWPSSTARRRRLRRDDSHAWPRRRRQRTSSSRVGVLDRSARVAGDRNRGRPGQRRASESGGQRPGRTGHPSADRGSDHRGGAHRHVRRERFR